MGKYNGIERRIRRRDNRNAVVFGLGVLALVAAIQFNIVRAQQFHVAEVDTNIQNFAINPTSDQEAFANSEGNEPASLQLDQDDLASLAKSSVARETELGQVVKSQKPQKKEVDLFVNDPAMSQKWDLNLTHAEEAWAKHRAVGSRSVKVCVIDTGADINHPDLKNNIWTNPGETGRDEMGRNKATNNVDDDGNGCVDDVHGCNFVDNNNNLADHHGHGTHIAGAIGAEGGNGIGISGVAPKVSLIIAKYYDPTALVNNNLLNTVRAIRYCVAVGANIINYSGGGLEPSDKEREAVALARDKGILFVAAAGNERSNSDVKKYYPADYGLDNIISVTAVDRERNVLPSSNYGAHSVDIAAPGKNIYSTLPGGNYGYLTGTSQATAIVTGVATLLLARFSDFDATRLARHITETGDWEPNKLSGKTKFQKRLNAYRALAILDGGVSVTGVVPKNVMNLNADSFSVNPGAGNESPAGREKNAFAVAPEGALHNFSQDLKKLLTQEDPQLRTR